MGRLRLWEICIKYQRDIRNNDAAPCEARCSRACNGRKYTHEHITINSSKKNRCIHAGLFSSAQLCRYNKRFHRLSRDEATKRGNRVRRERERGVHQPCKAATKLDV